MRVVKEAYLVELDFFEAVVSLLLIVHVEDLNELEGHHGLCVHLLCSVHERELALA